MQSGYAWGPYLSDTKQQTKRRYMKAQMFSFKSVPFQMVDARARALSIIYGFGVRPFERACLNSSVFYLHFSLELRADHE